MISSYKNIKTQLNLSVLGINKYSCNLKDEIDFLVNVSVWRDKT
ncbi:hypothetical protein J680_3601 [Acinetobacter baumannii 277047]|nr:hypothetical protein P673_0063 [Acinetobacter baumannii UH6507]EXE06869.1 hypothetical protein J556_1948 [Acinetobacter baumannii 1096934]EXR89434.1 hypothetical protein J680_3601 [Acinetobacter baumannii 277047]EXS37895.1 hypothetical protein J677_2316 [Acinetobacter baumannii 426863]